MAKVINSNESSGRGGRRSTATSFKEQIERAAALRDREIGLEGLVGGFAASAPVPPPTPPPGPHLPTASTLGIAGTPIVSGFLEDLGEYNAELAGRNAISTYEKMRRGDAQVRATLAACKLPVLSAKWDVTAGDVGAAPSGRPGPAQGPAPYQYGSAGERDCPFRSGESVRRPGIPDLLRRLGDPELG